MNTTGLKFGLVFALMVTLSWNASILDAQEKLENQASKDSIAQIVKSIKKLKSADRVVFKGSAENSADEAPDGGGVVMIVGGAGNRGKMFSEDFELVLLHEKEEILICSEKKLPAISIYGDGEDLIQSTTFLDEKYSIDDLGSDLTQVFKLDQLEKYVGRCKKIKSRKMKNGTLYQCELSSRLIRPAGSSGPMGMLAAKILKIEADFRVDGNGEIESITFAVTRANPMANLMKRKRRGGANIEINGGGIDDLDEDTREKVMSQIAGSDDEVTYTLKRKKDASKRSVDVLESMRKLALEK